MAFSIAGALPFVADSRRLFAQRPGIGSSRGSGPSRGSGLPGGSGDPVVAQIAREMARIHNASKKQGLRGEHVHEFAGQVRILMAHGRAVDLDTQARRSIGAAVDANGRDTIVDATDSDERVDATLRAAGVDPSDRRRRARLSHDRRAAILDSLLTSGVSPHFDRLEAALARAEAGADKFGAGVITGPRPSLAQDCWDSWGAIIDMMTGCAEFFAWSGMEELAAVFGMCALLCEVGMYVSCWGG
jgi:hypothetical protein